MQLLRERRRISFFTEGLIARLGPPPAGGGKSPVSSDTASLWRFGQSAKGKLYYTRLLMQPWRKLSPGGEEDIFPNLIGTVLEGRYQILKQIGKGGSGVVYLAYYLTLQKYVVVKITYPKVFDEAMLRHEADLLKNLHHTYLPQVYDYQPMGNSVYTVIDYIQGYSLEDYVSSGTKVDAANAKRWFEQLCEVLVYLHSQNPKIIHSDIKPANIIVTPDNNVCLIDFNISLDGSASVVGFSESYASPEQMYAAQAMINSMPPCKVDERTDIYSLGATFYSAISGYVPSSNGQKTLPLSQLMNDENVFYRVIDKCIRLEPDERYPSAQAALQASKNCFKMTKGYKLYNAARFVSIVLGVVMICAGVLSYLYGVSFSKTEGFKKQYTQITREYKRNDYEAVVRDGNDFINEGENRTYFENSPEISSNVMHLMASSYYELGDYENAAYYGRLSLENAGDELSDRYYEYITALLMANNVSEAKSAFDEASAMGLDLMYINILKLKFMYTNGDYADLLESFSQLGPEYSQNADCCELCAMACIKLNDYPGALGYQQTAYHIKGSNNSLRRLGEIYMELSQLDSMNGVNYGKNAAECFAQLVEGKLSISSDYINLLHCYVFLGDSVKASQTAKLMSELNSDDYRIYVETAEYYSKQGNQKLTRENAKKAQELFPKGELNDSDVYYKSTIDTLLTF